MKKLLYSASFLLVIGGAVSPSLSFGKNYNPEEGGEGGTVKCRKTSITSDYCVSGGKRNYGCVNTLANDDC